MKNLLKVFLLVLFLTTSGSAAMAAQTTTPPANTKTPGIVLATVNIENAKIISQDNHNFHISFNITNKNGIQTGVKYGIKLVTKNTKGQFLADEKVYDESLTLGENTTVAKDITYTAPSILEGFYSLVLFSSNTSGFPFGIDYVGDVALKSSNMGIMIAPESCFLQVEGEAKAPQYKLLQGVYVNKDQNLKLTCSATNKTTTAMTATPVYETRSRSAYGEIAQQAGGDTAAINFRPYERKTITVVLPKATTPQAYNVKMSLSSNGNVSNSIEAQYVIRGLSATIVNLSFDKNSYKSGDTANLSLVWSAAMPSDTKVNATAQLQNDRGAVCGQASQSISKASASGEPTVIPVSITANCSNPTASLALKDKDNNILDQKEFTMGSQSGQSASQKAANHTWLIIILALLLIIGIIISMKRKNNIRNTLPIVFLLILAAALPFHSVKADTYGDPTSHVMTDVNIDKGSGGKYVPSGTIKVTGTVSYVNSGGSQPVGEEYYNDHAGSPAAYDISYTDLSGAYHDREAVPYGGNICIQSGTGSGGDFGWLRYLGSCGTPSDTKSVILTAVTNSNPTATLVSGDITNVGDFVYGVQYFTAPHTPGQYTVDFETGTTTGNTASPTLTYINVIGPDPSNVSNPQMLCTARIDHPARAGGEIVGITVQGGGWVQEPDWPYGNQFISAGGCAVHIPAGQNTATEANPAPDPGSLGYWGPSAFCVNSSTTAIGASLPRDKGYPNFCGGPDPKLYTINFRSDCGNNFECTVGYSVSLDGPARAGGEHVDFDFSYLNCGQTGSCVPVSDSASVDIPKGEWGYDSPRNAAGRGEQNNMILDCVNKNTTSVDIGQNTAC
jgi:hypothetical protein